VPPPSSPTASLNPHPEATPRSCADTFSNFNITGSDLYDLFGKYGPIRQIRLGTDQNLKTKGTAYVVYESPDDAKEAMTHLNGFHLMERYIVGESDVLDWIG
jgi:pre-mRNA branch site protein p14